MTEEERETHNANANACSHNSRWVRPTVSSANRRH